jgi:hypothetical protein
LTSRIARAVGLQRQQAGDDLEIVLGAVVHLLEGMAEEVDPPRPLELPGPDLALVEAEGDDDHRLGEGYPAPRVNASPVSEREAAGAAAGPEYQMRAVPEQHRDEPARQPPIKVAMTTAMMPSAKGATSPRNGASASLSATKIAVMPMPTASSVTGLGSRRDRRRGRSIVTSLRNFPPSPASCYHKQAGSGHSNRPDQC